MFDSSYGKIPRIDCDTFAYPKRDLMVHKMATKKVNNLGIDTIQMSDKDKKAITCPKCGVFKKSGRASCCAPGGAWFAECGGADSSNAAHKWSEGVKACECESGVGDKWMYTPRIIVK